MSAVLAHAATRRVGAFAALQVERLIPCQPSAYQRALFRLIESELKSAEGVGIAAVVAFPLKEPSPARGPMARPVYSSPV